MQRKTTILFPFSSQLKHELDQKTYGAPVQTESNQMTVV